MLQKLFPYPFLILRNKQEIILKVSYFEKDFKKLTSFFLLNPVPFNEQSYKNKRGLGLVTSHTSGYKTSLEKFLCYILSD